MAILEVVSIGLSRIVLGTHFPYQVIAGWISGGIILLSAHRLEPRLIDAFGRIRLARAVAVLLVVCGVFFGLTALARGFHRAAPITNSTAARGPEIVDVEQTTVESIVSAVALFFGACTGLLLARGFLGQPLPPQPGPRLISVMIGFLGLLALDLLFSPDRPAEAPVLCYPFLFLHRSALAAWITAGLPSFTHRLRGRPLS